MKPILLYVHIHKLFTRSERFTTNTLQTQRTSGRNSSSSHVQGRVPVLIVVMTSLDFFVWGYVKDKVYATMVTGAKHLKTHTHTGIRILILGV